MQRALCRIKSTAYFIHSQHALPLVLLVTPQYHQALKPLIRTLTQSQNYPLIATIKRHTAANLRASAKTNTNISTVQGIELK